MEVTMVKDSFTQIAYTYLRNVIVKYDLKPGEAIVEQEISNALRISRTPVREALKLLESEGLVHHIPQRGTFVTEISTQDVEEIFALREALEVLALREAINDVTDQELTEVEQLLLTLDSDSSPENFYVSDRCLHELIVRHGRNRRLVNILNTLNSQVERLRQMSARRQNRLSESMQEHLDILKALKERNFKRAESMLRRHIKNVKESTLAVCKSL